MSFWTRRFAVIRSRLLAKHGDHDQSSHGNWAHGGGEGNDRGSDGGTWESRDSRRHYEGLARALRTARGPSVMAGFDMSSGEKQTAHDAAVSSIVSQLASKLQADNPNFDASRFVNAASAERTYRGMPHEAKGPVYSRSTYTMVADVLREARRSGQSADAVQTVEDQFAELFSGDNPRFNFEKFRAAARKS